VWNSGDNLTAFYIRGFTRLDESFELREDDDPDVEVTVPTGDYDLWQAGLFASTSASRPIVLSTQTFLQGIYDGTLHSITGRLSVAPSANLAVTASYTRNIIDVPDGAFEADVASLRLSYAFSTRLFLNTLLQYNSLDNEISANVRLNFIHRPGSDLFVVFNEQRGSKAGVWDFDNRTAVVKITYLARI
jgi:hypothetical protein